MLLMVLPTTCIFEHGDSQEVELIEFPERVAFLRLMLIRYFFPVEEPYP